MDDLAGILILAGLLVLSVPVLLIVALVAIGGLKRRVTALEAQLSQLRSARSQDEARAPAAATRAASQEEPADEPTLADWVKTSSAAESPLPAETPAMASKAGPPPLPPQSVPLPSRAAASTHAPRERPATASRLERPDIVTVAARAVKRWFTVGNIPVKIGVLVLFAGVAALLKYAANQGWLTVPPELRLAGIAAAALGALAFAWRKRESNRIFALSLQGGAIGVLLLVVFAAFKLYTMLPAGAAFALSIVLIAGAGMLAVLQDAKALAVFALLAGFLAPIWLSTGSGNHVALFSYYAVLNAAIVGIAWYKSWRVLNLLGFVFTFGIGTLWGVLDYAPEKYASTQPFLLLFFAFYLLIPLLFARRQPVSRRDFIDGCLVFGMPLVAFSLQAGLLQGLMPGESRMPLALCALGLAALYTALAAGLRRRDHFNALAQSYALLAVGFATLAVPLALSAQATASVFALEGAALIWLGLHQQRRLPQFSGVGLQLAAAFAFSVAKTNAGDIAVAVANPAFMSALLIALAGFASAWSYRRAGYTVAALLFYLWGLLWWSGNGIHEVDRFVRWSSQADALLAFAALTGWLAAEMHRRRPATALIATTLCALAAAAPLALAQADAHQHPFGGLGVWAWLAYAVLGVRSLLCLRAGEHRLAGWAQLSWWLVWPFAVSMLLAWASDRFALEAGWRMVGVALPWWLIAAASLFRWPWLASPLGERFDPLRPVLQTLYFTVLGLWWLWSLAQAGDSAPLPWLPLLNPMELMQLAIVALAARWLWSAHAPESLRSLRVFKLAAAGFLLVTSVTLHTVHHWGGIAWDGALVSTSLAQTSLTVVWSVLGVLGWVIGSRRGQRGLWLAGAVLMAVVLGKLLLVDRGNLGDVLGIASFIAYGLLCTVVGYLAPAPPRSPGEENAA